MLEEDGARSGLQALCRYGCYTALLPYRWDPTETKLLPGSRSKLFLFKLHKNLTLVYLAYMWFRLVQVYLQGDFSLLSGLWAVGNISTAAALVTMGAFKDEVMHVANRLLSNTFLGISVEPVPDKKCIREDKSVELQKIKQLECQDRKMMSRHMYFNLLLLYTNPEFHSLIVYQNPCAVNFVSSLVYPCRSAMDRPVTMWEQLPFLIFEAYITVKWQVVCSFMWCCIFLGLGAVGTEVKTLEKVKLESCSTRVSKHWDAILLQLRKCELAVKYINSTFRIYLIALPAVGVVVVALLLYGTVRLWRIDPQSNVMFPICAIRCGFEALTPLAMAGTLNDLSGDTLQKWKRLLEKKLFWKPTTEKFNIPFIAAQLGAIFGQSATTTHSNDPVVFVHTYRRKLQKAMQKSCRKLKCTSGPLFPFESSIVFVTVDNCIQITVNLLVSFPADG